jgi:N-hydroxyarylamine O-acetyltransferase
MSVDLARYFERIQYRGSREPSLTTLSAILLQHVRHIPFENLDVLLQAPISLELAAVEHKLVDSQRGGYCFEHNTLLLAVLEQLGFRGTMLSARSCYQRAERGFLPRTHVLLCLEVDGRTYLADGGFGGLSPTAAQRLELDVVQATPHEPRRLRAEGPWRGLELRAPDALLVHEAYFADAWHGLYEFTLEQMPLVDRVVANFYTSQHPQSHFRQRLMVARATEAGRVTLQDRELTLRRAGAEPRTRRLESHAELIEVLAEHFQLRLPAGTRLSCPTLAELR